MNTFFFLIFLHLKPTMEFTAQVNAMQHLKEQLEQRTIMIQNNIQRQQEELRQIQEQLQKVQGQGIQVGGEQSLPHYHPTITPQQNVSGGCIFSKCRPHLIFKAGCLVCKSVWSPLFFPNFFFFF